MALGVADPVSVVAASRDDVTATRRLFAAAEAALAPVDVADFALTAYGEDGRPLAWDGRPSDLPADRLQGEEAWFLAQGALGLRLVYVTPVVLPNGPRVGSVAAERSLAFGSASREAWTRFATPARLHPSRSRCASKAGPPHPPHPPSMSWRHQAASCSRRRWTPLSWRKHELAGVEPPRPWRSSRWASRSPCSRFRCSTGGATGRTRSGAVCARVRDSRHRSGADLPDVGVSGTLVGAFAVLGIGLLVTRVQSAPLVAVRVLRLCRRGGRPGRLVPQRCGRVAFAPATPAPDGDSRLRARATLRRRLVGDAARGLPGLSPKHGRQHHARPAPLLVAPVEPVEAGAAHRSHRVARKCARMRSARASRGVGSMGSVANGLAIPQLRASSCGRCRFSHTCSPRECRRGGHSLNSWPLPVAISLASFTSRVTARYRHGSQAFRLTMMTLALVVPAMAFYPSLYQLGWQAKARLVETRYAQQAINQRQTTQLLLQESLSRDRPVSGLDGTHDPAVGASWHRGARPTAPSSCGESRDLAMYPVTSSVELYGADGSSDLSRFAFNLPDDLTAAPSPLIEESCTWDVYEERLTLLRRGATDPACRPRHLRRRRPAARIDRRPRHARLRESAASSLSQSPYVELMRPVDPLRARRCLRPRHRVRVLRLEPTAALRVRRDGLVARRCGVSTRGTSPNPRLGAPRNGVTSAYDVYLLNDRAGIYALGFPVASGLDHLVSLAEITVLAWGTQLMLLTATALLGAFSLRGTTARALLREIRASFYRKLLLAFIARHGGAGRGACAGDQTATSPTRCAPT